MTQSPTGKAPGDISTSKYDPLPDNESIRMLVLHPGRLDDPLVGTLEFVNIQSPGVYEALSYVWGDSTRTQKIVCNGTDLELTTSLYDALRRLRLTDKVRRVWADQICIDQENLDERSQQVQFMNSIYWNANHVLVWLGRDDQKAANSAFKLVYELAEKFKDEIKRAQFGLDHTDRLEEQSGEVWVPLKCVTALAWVSEATAKSSSIYSTVLFPLLTSTLPHPVHSSMDSTRNRYQSPRNRSLGGE